MGDSIDTNEACAIGLVNRVVPMNELNNTVLELAGNIAKKSAIALKMLKRCVNMRQESGLSSVLSFEALSAVANWNCTGRQEGIEAFLPKRVPEFNQKG